MLNKIQIYVSRCIILSIFYYTTLLFSGDTNVYTPEGRQVPADTPSEMSSYYINYYNNLIDDYIRDPNGDDDYSDEICAIRIGNSSNTYNCHGYAWSISEGGSTVWIGTTEDLDVEIYYWTDGVWSNDGQPSYLVSSESEATHAWYSNPGDDHSVRKIQNSYPRAIVYEDFQVHSNMKLDYVSKWGFYGKYQHAKGHDIYKQGSTSGFAFKKLKTTHYGTLSSYPKTWVGAGGITHTITGDVTVPSNKDLTITGDVTITRSNQNYNIKFSPGSSAIVIKDGSSLSVSGSENNLFKFYSNSASPSRSDWYGFWVGDGSSIDLNYCEIADATGGIQTDEIEEFSVQNSHIHHTNYHGILVDIPYGKTANILNNFIYDNVRCGIMAIPNDGIANIKYNVIYDNYDSGMFVQLYRGYIYNNTVTNNNDGIWVGGSSGSSYIYVKNNIVTSNNKSGYGSEHYGIWSGTSTGTEILTYNNVYNNSSGNYYGCTAGTGSISADPLFNNAASDDYTLDYYSPCIDAGDPSSIYNDPDGTRNDMGALYHDTHPSKPTNVAIENYNDNPRISWDANSEPDLRRYRVYRLNGDPSVFYVTGTSYVDEDVYVSQSGTDIRYHVKAEDWSGYLSVPSDEVSIHGYLGKEYASNLFEQDKLILPSHFILFQNFPNPFNPSTFFRFGIPVAADITIEIFNSTGKKVRVFKFDNLNAGYHTKIWDSNNEFGNAVSSGMYIYRFIANAVESNKHFESTNKMLLIR